MNNRFKMTVAAAALLAGTGFAYAQGTGMSHEGSSGRRRRHAAKRALFRPRWRGLSGAARRSSR